VHTATLNLNLTLREREHKSMGLFSTIGTIAGSAFGPLGSAAGGTIGGLIDGSQTSGGGDPRDGGQSPHTSPAIDYYSRYGAQAAALNNPLTASMQGLALLQGSLGGALGLSGTQEANAQLSVLGEAMDRSSKATSAQSAMTQAAYGAGLGLKTALGQAKLGTELAGPNYLAQAGSAALAGENQLANQLATTNLGLRALQEQTRAQVAAKQAETLAGVFATRAQTAAQLTLGAQQLESGLKLLQGQTLQSLANTKAATKAQLSLDRSRANRAMAGQRFFA